MIRTFSSGVPPAKSSGRALARPRSPGSISYVSISPSRSSLTRVGPVEVISSSPSEPCTTKTCSDPKSRSTPARVSVSSLSYTPMTCRRAPAGLVNGPSTLKIVRTPISRLGPIAYFIAPWSIGANRNPMPTSSRQTLTRSGGVSMFTPSAFRTSALPHRLDTDRLPCLATHKPAAATTNAAVVEMLKVPEPSPPVPHVSTTTS